MSYLRNFFSGVALLGILIFLPSVVYAESGGYCGLSPGDWCESPRSDPCGRYKNETECRNDPKCIGREYRGESVEACKLDARNFASNCPTVGCVSPCESLEKDACVDAVGRCVWGEGKCIASSN